MRQTMAIGGQRAIIAAFLAACVTACAGSPPPIVGPVSATPSPAMGQESYSNAVTDTYRLRPSDVISVTVFREPDFSVASLPVSADGTIAMPLIGLVKASGRNAADLAKEVAWRLDDAGLKYPDVTINVLEHASHLVTVEGGVETPGVYPFQPGARLSSAIALASGSNRVAKLDEVAIFRESAEGMQVARFDYSAIRQGASFDPVIQPGDRVVVGISGLSQFWQDVIKTLPAFGIFANVAR